MSGSWGHTLRPLTKAEIAAAAQGDAAFPDSRWRDSQCRSPRCTDEARWEGTYRYVTGRSGRVSWARKRLCDGHADRFRAKYQPTQAQGPAAHATEQVVRQALPQLNPEEIHEP